MDSSEYQRLLTDIVRQGAAPGAAVILSQHGTRTFAAAGSAISTAEVPITLHSRIQLGCIAKLMTAIVALELAANRRFDLDTVIESYLPELQGTSLGRSVRPRHLLTHTSGYRGPNIGDPAVRYYYTWAKLVELLRLDERLFDPGAFFNYEHSESVLLGEIICRITGRDIVTLHDEVVLAPLGIEPSSENPSYSQNAIVEHDFNRAAQRFLPLRPAPSCHFWRASLSDRTLSLTDLVKVGEAAAGLDAERILHRETVAMLQKPHIWLPACIGGALREEIPSSFGFGAAQYGACIFGHNGSARGQTLSLRCDPRAGIVAVVALNVWRPHVRDLICRKILATGPDEAALSPCNIPDWEFKDVTGGYAGGFGTTADVCEENGHLTCTLRASGARSDLRLTVRRTAERRLQLTCDAPQITLGFSQTHSGAVSLMMVGLSTYRRNA